MSDVDTSPSSYSTAAPVACPRFLAALSTRKHRSVSDQQTSNGKTKDDADLSGRWSAPRNAIRTPSNGGERRSCVADFCAPARYSARRTPPAQSRAAGGTFTPSSRVSPRFLTPHRGGYGRQRPPVLSTAALAASDCDVGDFTTTNKESGRQVRWTNRNLPACDVGICCQLPR